MRRSPSSRCRALMRLRRYKYKHNELPYVLFVPLFFIIFRFFRYICYLFSWIAHTGWMKHAHASTVYSCAPHISLRMWVRDWRTCAHVFVPRALARWESGIRVHMRLSSRGVESISFTSAIWSTDRSWRWFVTTADSSCKFCSPLPSVIPNFANWPKEMVNFGRISNGLLAL